MKKTMSQERYHVCPRQLSFPMSKMLMYRRCFQAYFLHMYASFWAKVAGNIGLLMIRGIKPMNTSNTKAYGIVSLRILF